MLISNYQITETIIGTILFPIIYYYYLKVSGNEINNLDIFWCSISLCIIFLFRNFYLNYNLLQNQTENYHIKI